MVKPPPPQRPRRARTIPPAFLAPGAKPFPRAVPTYVGRDAELRRALELLDRETLHVVYGVGGVGKSELVFKLIEEAQVTPRWIGAAATLVAVRPQMPVEHVLAALRLAAGARPARRGGPQTSGAARLEDDLAEVARLLDATPLLVFVDDLHHLDLAPTAPAAQMLGYLSRHVRGSRIIVASRVEVPLPPGTPPPAVHRLGPLDERATAALVTQLSDRLGGASVDAGEVFRRSGGSPFYVLRELAGAGAADPASGLEQTLAELDAVARALLLALATARGRVVPDELGAIAGEHAGRALRELARRFLVDVARPHVMVHDLVRDAALRAASRRDLAAAHRACADVLRARLEPGLSDERTKTAIDPSDAVDAVFHLVRAGEVDDAWELAARTYRTVAAAGLDHLLLDDLRALGSALAEAREPVVLMTARIQIRRSLIAEAADTLAAIGDRGPAASQRWLMLAGEVAQRRGRLGEAEELFRRARSAAEGAPARFHAALALADVASLRGRNAEARAVLADELAALGAGAGPRERARWGWSLALSYVLEERFAAAAAAARSAADGIAGAGFDDLELLLAMIEVLARCECDDVTGSQALLDRVVGRAVAMGALREHAVDLYGGVLRAFRGDAVGAREVLGRAIGYLENHADHVMSSIGGYYLLRAMLAVGDTASALEVSAAMTRLAAESGLETLAPHGRAAQAEALLVAGRLAEARALAEAALGGGRPGAGARLLAHQVLARAAALEGDLAEARRRLAQAEADALGALDDALGDAATLAAGRAAAVAALDLERAGIELHGGDTGAALAAATRALDHYGRAGRSGMIARAAVARAAALLAGAADPPALADAARLLDDAERLADAGGHARVRCRAALLRGALAARRGDHDGARAQLAAAAAQPWAVGDHGEGRALRAVAGGREVAPGVRAMLSSLGLVAGARHKVTTRGGSRVVVDAELERVRAAHRLVVEPARATITARGEGGAPPGVDRGRPLACELLAALIEAQGQPVSAEALFLGVWGGHEYHPLRHRNTVYVAVKRLRQTLRALLDDDGESIETTAAGWRLADDLDGAAIRPAEG